MADAQISAAIIIIGDEILAGRIRDQNSPFLIKELSDQGVEVRYCLTIPDDVEVIAEVVKEYSAKVTWMFTAGGIGPTHDDITMEGIGKAFKTQIVSSPNLEKTIITAYGDRFRPEHLKMAKVPEGTELVCTQKPRFPVVQFRNIIILPGVPEFLKVLFLSVKDQFQGIKIPVREINLLTEEGIIASVLHTAIDRYPGVKIGSYPCFIKQGCIVKLVIEHQDSAELDKVVAFFEAEIGEFIQG